MKCYCVETDEKFIYCVEEAEEIYRENIEHAWFKKEGDKYIKEYQNPIEDNDIIKNNFARIGESMFKSEGDWGNVLKLFAEKCLTEKIEWYVTGSISECVMGVDINPHDIDIIANVNDFYKIKPLFFENLIEPFVDNKGTWVVQYFGRLCINGVMLDIAADNKLNKENHEYTKIMWNGYELMVEPLNERYRIEIQRNRIERINKIKNYMENAGTSSNKR